MESHMKPQYLCPNKYANGGTHEQQYLCPNKYANGGTHETIISMY